MGQVDALKAADHLRQRLVDLAVTENFVTDKSLADACRNVWSSEGKMGGLVSELWVEGAFPGELSRDTLQSLAKEGVFPQDLLKHIGKREVFPPERALYSHQSEAIRISANHQEAPRPSLVISAGTGLGKTEAFLLPVLSDLWSAPERQEDGGMRCLILYPMNALIADQVSRVYEWLKEQTKHTVFHFTSETPENKNAADKAGVEEYDPCRFRTRQQARGYESLNGHISNSVPDIVITNYSMLEYMLCRPQDRRFFGPDLRCIILDEAHLYSGTLAAEITMLLRRVRQRCGVEPSDILQIATSATLGGDENELRDFASRIFSDEPKHTRVISCGYADVDLGDEVSNPASAPTASELTKYSDINPTTINAYDSMVSDDPESVSQLDEVARLLVASSSVDKAENEQTSSPGPFLWQVMRQSPVVRSIVSILYREKEKGNITSLSQLAKEIFPHEREDDAKKAMILLLRIGASARRRADELPVIPHRLHLLVRAPEGLALCLNSQCNGPEEIHASGLGCVQGYADRCRYCDHIALPLYRCDHCGQWALSACKDVDHLMPGYYEDPKGNKREHLFFVDSHDCSNALRVVLDTESGEMSGDVSRGLTLWQIEDINERRTCPKCGSDSGSSDDANDKPRGWKPLKEGWQFAISVVAETLLHDLPVFPGNSRDWKPGKGRRLLSFSDSRRGAARLGVRLTNQHERTIIRSAIARIANEHAGSEESLKHFAEEVHELENKLKGSDLSKEKRSLIEAKLENAKRDLQQARSGMSFSTFASLFSKDAAIQEILHRDKAEDHKAKEYTQEVWDENAKVVSERAEALIALELDPLRKNTSSVEAVGLIEIAYPGIEKLEIPPEVEKELPTVDMRETFKEVWPDFVALLLDSIRMSSCIDWSEANDKRQWMGDSPLEGRWTTRSEGSSRFCGSTMEQTRRWLAAQVLRSINCPPKEIERLSEVILKGTFDQLYTKSGNDFAWLRKKESYQIKGEKTDKAIQLLLDRLSLRRPSLLYRCETTGTIWTHSALGWAPVKGCTGSLKPVKHEQLDYDPEWGRARRELIESPIFQMGLWGEEHSAQLTPQENRRLQDLFKAGIRNVLSSTTTMELGIDIGGLNGVLLGNVPPGQANHRQRAGRAGRRADGSAIVVTYARDMAFDREVFQRFDDFMRKPLRKPTVSLDRDRIIRRHLHAVFLSDFIRKNSGQGKTGAMQAFGHMGSFCGQQVPHRWEGAATETPKWPSIREANLADKFLQFLSSLNQETSHERERLSELTNGTALEEIAGDEGWRKFIKQATESYQAAIEEWRDSVQQLKEVWEDSDCDSKSYQAHATRSNAIRYQVKLLCEMTLIEWMADHRFLPRYGFPINLQKLEVRRPVDEKEGKSVPDERYRLERSSLLALSEYVPGSSVLVGGVVAVSRGIKKHWTDSNRDRALGLQYRAVTCLNEHVFMDGTKDSNPVCPSCQSPNRKIEELLFPRYGYVTAASETPKRNADLDRIGESQVCPVAFSEEGEEKVLPDFFDIPGLKVTYREDAPILIRNAGESETFGFAVCTKCGYSMSESKRGKGRMNLPSGFERHTPVYSTKEAGCWKKNEEPPVLRNKVLAARELTDMILMEWPDATKERHNGLYSLGRALTMAATRILEQDERELGMEIIPRLESMLGIVIYEAPPGGAGHLLEIRERQQEWLDVTRRILIGSDEHNERCERACLDCILDFSGQYKAHLLNRKEAIRILPVQ